MMALTAALAATMLNVGAISPAAAATTARVSYRDLDLGTSAGQTQLTHRLNRAASHVCGDPSRVAMLSEMMACRTDAVSRARADLSAVLGTASPTVLR